MLGATGPEALDPGAPGSSVASLNTDRPETQEPSDK